ncbi:MAG: DUF1292 domain-containing protein [Vallitalea sp.]|jgi:uncharacterized protein YrzB (UPF0473 family)|nr:DUF1292 domain-containing protein [Vallitalea sp.]
MNNEKNCNCNDSNEQNNNCQCHEHDHEHDHDCCNHDHNHEHETITLTLDNDETLECLVLGIFDVEDNEYIALLPEEEDDVLLYKYISSDDQDIELTNIEDDEEFEKVSKTFMRIIEDEEELEEEDNN